MKKKFKTDRLGYKDFISVVEIEKETEKILWIKGRKHAKISSCEAYFDTFEEAKDFLLEWANKRIRIEKQTLLNSEDLLRRIQNLKKSDLK